jgi:hypothetical protein
MSTTMGETRPRAFEPTMADRLGTSRATPGWDLATERRADDGETLANMLGWFSIGLGIAEVAAAERLCEFLGMEDRTQLVRLYGVREFAKGVGILTNRKPEKWMWGRIAGDVLDLCTLATRLSPDNPKRRRVIGAMAAVAGVMVLDVISARQLSQSLHHRGSDA